MLSLILLFASSGCPANKVEVHGVASRSGRLDVYSSTSLGDVDATVKLVAGKKWSVCVTPTDRRKEVRPDGPYVPWFDEVQYTFSDKSTKHERWAVPSDEKSVSVESIRTDGVLS